jgi:hypothetical protein
MPQTSPCPVCGGPRLNGWHHFECRTATEPGLYEIMQQFDWRSDDGKLQITFNVTGLLRAIASGEVPVEKIRCQIDLEWAYKELPRRDLNKDYIISLTRSQAEVPLLMVETDPPEADGTLNGLVIDGSHRYAALVLHHSQYFNAHFVRTANWQPYAVITEHHKD